MSANSKILAVESTVRRSPFLVRMGRRGGIQRRTDRRKDRQTDRRKDRPAKMTTRLRQPSSSFIDFAPADSCQ
jgi:hypothetical protein